MIDSARHRPARRTPHRRRWRCRRRDGQQRSSGPVRCSPSRPCCSWAIRRSSPTCRTPSASFRAASAGPSATGRELAGQRARARPLVVAAGLGGLTGACLLLVPAAGRRSPGSCRFSSSSPVGSWRSQPRTVGLGPRAPGAIGRRTRGWRLDAGPRRLPDRHLRRLFRGRPGSHPHRAAGDPRRRRSCNASTGSRTSSRQSSTVWRRSCSSSWPRSRGCPRSCSRSVRRSAVSSGRSSDGSSRRSPCARRSSRSGRW